MAYNWLTQILKKFSNFISNNSDNATTPRSTNGTTTGNARLDLADKYWSQAEAARNSGQYLDAAQLFEKFTKTVMDMPNPKFADLSFGLSRVGYCYYKIVQYDKALKYYEESLEICKKLGDEGDVASLLNSIGQVYNSLKQDKKALKYYEESLAIGRKLGNDENIATVLNNIGKVYYSWGLNDKTLMNKALQYYDESSNSRRPCNP